MSLDILNEDDLIERLINKGAYAFTRKHSTLHNIDTKKTHHNVVIILTGYINIVNNFFNDFVPKIKGNITLVLVETDFVELLHRYLNIPQIKAVYTWNCPVNHHKVFALPIGLNKDRQYKPINDFLNNNKDKSYQKSNDKILLVNHNNDTNVLRPFIFDFAKENWDFADCIPYMTTGKRTIIKSKIEDKILVVAPPANYYDMLSKYKFCFSPPGAGVDCHRTYECLLLGVVPVCICQNLPEEKALVGLPIIWIDDYKNLTKEYLEKEVMNLESNPSLYQITNSFWVDKIIN